MGYTSNDLFFDAGELFDMFSLYFKKRINSLSKRIKKLSEIDYLYLITTLFQNLPEALLIVFLGFFAVYNLLKYSEGALGNKIYPIITNSMYPSIKPGSLIYSTPQTIYQEGDIISYTERSAQGIETGKLLTHRIIKENEDQKYIAKGDANENPDPVEINKSQIHGRVVLVLPIVGYIDVITKTLPGFIVFILIPSLFLIIRHSRELKSFLD
jgi:signal peptidase